MTRKSPTLQSVRDMIVRLLAPRDHSRAELARKLRKRRVPGELIETALNWAQELGYLDDPKVAAAYVAELRRKGFGPLMIRKKLQERGVGHLVPEDLADTEDQLVRATAIVERKFGSVDALEPKEKLRAARYLARRGFYSEVVREALGPLPRI